MNCQINDGCGAYPFLNTKGTFLITSLKDDVSHYINSPDPISEGELLINRMTSLDMNGYICSKHRYKLGIHYGKYNYFCAFLTHQNKKKKINKTEMCSWSLYSVIVKKYPGFVLGSFICRSCKKKVLAGENNNNDCENMDPNFCLQNPGEYTQEQQRLKLKTDLNALCENLGVQSVHQILKPVSELSNTILLQYKRTLKSLKDKLEEEFAKRVAPGQSEEFMKLISANENDIDVLIKAYKQCHTSKGQISILSLVPKHYSKMEIINTFMCTKYQIDTARNKKEQLLDMKTVTRKPYRRFKLDLAYHFIDYLWNSGLFQEEAYGVTKLKFDSKDSQIVSKTILLGLKQHAVDTYLLYCNEISITPLSESSLRKILDEIKPSTRKRLAGIDNYIVDGIEGIEVCE